MANRIWAWIEKQHAKMSATISTLGNDATDVARSDTRLRSPADLALDQYDAALEAEIASMSDEPLAATALRLSDPDSIPPRLAETISLDQALDDARIVDALSGKVSDDDALPILHEMVRWHGRAEAAVSEAQDAALNGPQALELATMEGDWRKDAVQALMRLGAKERLQEPTTQNALIESIDRVPGAGIAEDVPTQALDPVREGASTALGAIFGPDRSGKDNLKAVADAAWRYMHRHEWIFLRNDHPKVTVSRHSLCKKAKTIAADTFDATIAPARLDFIDALVRLDADFDEARIFLINARARVEADDWTMIETENLRALRDTALATLSEVAGKDPDVDIEGYKAEVRTRHANAGQRIATILADKVKNITLGENPGHRVQRLISPEKTLVDRAEAGAVKRLSERIDTRIADDLTKRVFPLWKRYVWVKPEETWDRFRATLARGSMIDADLAGPWDVQEMQKNVALGSAIRCIDEAGRTVLKPSAELSLIYAQEPEGSRTYREDSVDGDLQGRDTDAKQFAYIDWARSWSGFKKPNEEKDDSATKPVEPQGHDDALKAVEAVRKINTMTLNAPSRETPDGEGATEAATRADEIHLKAELNKLTEREGYQSTGPGSAFFSETEARPILAWIGEGGSVEGSVDEDGLIAVVLHKDSDTSAVSARSKADNVATIICHLIRRTLGDDVAAGAPMAKKDEQAVYMIAANEVLPVAIDMTGLPAEDRTHAILDRLSGKIQPPLLVRSDWMGEARQAPRAAAVALAERGIVRRNALINAIESLKRFDLNENASSRRHLASHSALFSSIPVLMGLLVGALFATTFFDGLSALIGDADPRYALFSLGLVGAVISVWHVWKLYRKYLDQPAQPQKPDDPSVLLSAFGSLLLGFAISAWPSSKDTLTRPEAAYLGWALFLIAVLVFFSFMSFDKRLQEVLSSSLFGSGHDAMTGTEKKANDPAALRASDRLRFWLMAIIVPALLLLLIIVFKFWPVGTLKAVEGAESSGAIRYRNILDELAWAMPVLGFGVLVSAWNRFGNSGLMTLGHQLAMRRLKQAETLIREYEPLSDMLSGRNKTLRFTDLEKAANAIAPQTELVEAHEARTQARFVRGTALVATAVVALLQIDAFKKLRPEDEKVKTHTVDTWFRDATLDVLMEPPMPTADQDAATLLLKRVSVETEMTGLNQPSPGNPRLLDGYEFKFEDLEAVRNNLRDILGGFRAIQAGALSKSGGGSANPDSLAEITAILSSLTTAINELARHEQAVDRQIAALTEALTANGQRDERTATTLDTLIAAIDDAAPGATKRLDILTKTTADLVDALAEREESDATTATTLTGTIERAAPEVASRLDTLAAKTQTLLDAVAGRAVSEEAASKELSDFIESVHVTLPELKSGAEALGVKLDALIRALEGYTGGGNVVEDAPLTGLDRVALADALEVEKAEVEATLAKLLQQAGETPSSGFRFGAIPQECGGNDPKGDHLVARAFFPVGQARIDRICIGTQEKTHEQCSKRKYKDIRKRLEATIDAATKAAKEANSPFSYLLAVGFTDIQGSPRDNLRLSSKRAKAMKKALTGTTSLAVIEVGRGEEPSSVLVGPPPYLGSSYSRRAEIRLCHDKAGE